MSSQQPRVSGILPTIMVVVGGWNLLVNGLTEWVVWMCMFLLVGGGVGWGLWLSEAGTRDSDTHPQGGDAERGSVHG